MQPWGEVGICAPLGVQPSLMLGGGDAVLGRAEQLNLEGSGSGIREAFMSLSRLLSSCRAFPDPPGPFLALPRGCSGTSALWMDCVDFVAIWC